jgi:hypothetical protein
MSIGRVRAVFGVKMRNVPAVVGRAEAMHNGMAADPATYAGPNLPLPTFKTLIANVQTAQTAVRTRVVGAAATRDVHLLALIGGMETERLFIQGLADANSSHSVQLIQNAGLVVAESPGYTKLLLVLRNGPHQGSVVCDANVGLLVAGANHPRAARFFGWQYTVDGGTTFVTAPTTATGKTLLTGLTPLTVVGVRVNITLLGVTSDWTDVGTIVVL